MKSYRAFTTIELFAVIAIIVMLAGTLHPALATVRDRARAINCTSSLKQYGLRRVENANHHSGLTYYYYDPANGTTEAWAGISPYKLFRP